MQCFYTLQIKLLILLNPPKLFQKINQLDWYQDLLHEWIETQKLTPQSQLLEVGCATGALSKYLSDSSHQVISVDASRKMINLAQSTYKGLDFQVADAYHLSFNDNTFNAVLSSSLINVLDNRQQAINEMFRVCKIGGKVSILVPLKSFNNKSLEKLQEELNLEGFSKSALSMWHKSATKMSLEEIETLFQGYEVELVDYLGGMIGTVTIIKQNS